MRMDHMKTAVRMALLAGCLSASLNVADSAIVVSGSEGGIVPVRRDNTLPGNR